MSRERAETYLRLLAEDARRRQDLRRLNLVTYALTVTGAVDVTLADQIRQEARLAAAVRTPDPLAHLAHERPPRAQAPVVRAPDRPHVVLLGQLTRFTDELFHGDLCVLAFTRGGRGAHLVIAWEHTSSGSAPPAVHDDRGVSYQLVYRNLGRPVPASGAGVLALDPPPPPDVRWLDLTLFAGQPAVRVDVCPPPGPPPDLTVTPAALSPGEFLLEAIAAQILSRAPKGSPYAVRLGDIVAALRAVGQLPADSLLPGQLLTLCRRLDARDHGLDASPGRLPARWGSVLDGLAQPPPVRGPDEMVAGADLGEIDGARYVLLGLRHGESGTSVFLQASGGTMEDVTLEDDWEYIRPVRPMPVLWLRDRSGGWHTVASAGLMPDHDLGVVTLRLEVVPPLPDGLAGVEVIAVGRSAQIRVRLPARPAG